MKEKSYKEWYDKIRFLNNKIITPDGTTYSKEIFITKNGFDLEEFDKFLKELYNGKRN